jgi:threonine dehydratase
LPLHELNQVAEAADSVALRHDYLKKTLTARGYAEGQSAHRWRYH